MALGATVTLVFGPSRLIGGTFVSSGLDDAPSVVPLAGESDRGVCAFESVKSLSSSSFTPNDNFPFVTFFRCFFGGRCGVEALYFDH